MVDLTLLSEVLQNTLNLGMIILILASVFYGMIFGAVPGLGPLVALALLFPITLTMSPLPAIVMLASAYPAAVYGGSISATLLNTPGTPASTVTTFDGYPLTKQGKGAYALGVSLFSSVIGGIFGVLVLLFFAPTLANVALQAGPNIIFAIATFGVVIVVIVSRGSVLKGLIAACMGMLLSFIGFSSQTGTARFVAVDYLSTGLPILPIAVGLFAVSEALILTQQEGVIADEESTELGTDSESKGSKSDILGLYSEFIGGFREVLRRPINLVRSSAIGAIVGIFPGAGSVVSNFLSYFVAESRHKGEIEFGSGSTSGLVAAEASNNATTGASLVPTLLLGIPGSISAALIIGVFYLQNVRIGPRLFVETPVLAYSIIFSLLFANIGILIIALIISPQISRISTVRVEYVASMIIFISILGAFAYNFSTLDAIAVILIGFAAFALRKLHYSPAALIFGYILGPILEDNYHQAVQLGDGPMTLITSPISGLLLLFATIMFIAQIVRIISPYIRGTFMR